MLPRITIIPALHGKLTADRKVSEPDIYFILEKWLQRHPEVRRRERDIRISRGRLTLSEGICTEAVRVTIANANDLIGYDPTQDADLYEYFLAADQDGNGSETV